MIEKIEEIDMKEFRSIGDGESVARHIANSLLTLARKNNALIRKFNELAEVVNKLNSTGDN